MKNPTALLLSLALAAAPVLSAASKNWKAPDHKIYGQTLVDQLMATHPELISTTFHGSPPGLDKVYTMFAGSFPERIGNADDPDDIYVIETGCTILDPRWHKMHDTVKKYDVQLPLHDASGANVGLLVLAFHKEDTKSDLVYLGEAEAIRDALAKQIPTYAALFEPAP